MTTWSELDKELLTYLSAESWDQAEVELNEEALDSLKARLSEILSPSAPAIGNRQKPIPVTDPQLTDNSLPIPTSSAIVSSINAQIRKDLWCEDLQGIAYFRHQAKGNPNNYIEHYITNPGDIEILPGHKLSKL